MRAKDLGFAEPCRACIRQIQVGFRGQGPTAHINSPVTNEELFPVIPGPLYEVSGKNRSSAEGYTRYFACRLCGSRWWFFDWVCTGTVDYGEESADGRYLSRSGVFVDEKKHGLYGYYRYDERGDALVLSETWEYGKLAAWSTFGPEPWDADGNLASVRSWHARNVVLTTRVSLGYSLNHLHVCFPKDLAASPGKLSKFARLMQRDQQLPATSADQVGAFLEEALRATPDATVMRNLRENLPRWPEDMRLGYAGAVAFGLRQFAKARVSVQQALRCNRQCLLARQVLRLLGAKKDVRCPYGTDPDQVPDVIAILRAAR